MDLPKDINYQILLQLDDKSLVKFCQINREADKLCKNQTFWMNRILTKFPYIPLEILKKYKGDRTWSDYYIHDLRKINESRDKELYKAIGDGRLDHVMIFTENGIKRKNSIIFAVIYGNLDIIKYLVNKGADVNQKSDSYFPPLTIAVRQRYLDVVKYLVDKGANVNVRVLGFTPLSEALAGENKEIIDYLISKGAK